MIRLMVSSKGEETKFISTLFTLYFCALLVLRSSPFLVLSFSPLYESFLPHSLN
jgi:hypothetical protein